MDFRTTPLGPRGPITCRALATWPKAMVRRSADTGRVVVLVGEEAALQVPIGSRRDPFSSWRAFLRDHPGWSYGLLCYELKDHVEDLRSCSPVRHGWPLLWWAVPRFVVELAGGEAWLHAPAEREEEGLRWAEELFHAPGTTVAAPGSWVPQIDRMEYLLKASRLHEHLLQGDIYEVNLCTLRTCHAPGWDPFAAADLLDRSLMPAYGGMVRVDDQVAISASPERFLRTQGRTVMAEPMKGTRTRHADPEEDARAAIELMTDRKERGENIMAVDVMRNDLSRVAAPRSVAVPELCVVRPHGHVHQMVSTVTAILREGFGPADLVRACFPMASMTGAPKERAMQLIEEVEGFRRGLFSGSFGYIDGVGGLDLNVVIRTLEHDLSSGLTSLATGSALTALSDAEQEWDECQLKAGSITRTWPT